MRITTRELAEATGGDLVGEDVVVDGATIDSRLVRAGQLFVPVVADRDGHDFVADALAGGAVAYLSSTEHAGATAVLVEDTVTALAAAGRLARSRLPDRVVGVTGSVGKTSVKDLLEAVLAQRWATAANVRSFNNELGVPLTLLEAPDGTEAVIVELGARDAGHVQQLCDIARPTIGVVTVVAAAHTEVFGSIDDVARAKAELVVELPSTGTAVLNADDDRVAAMARHTAARVLTFGQRGEVRAVAVRLDDELRPAFRLESPWGEIEVQLAARGLHQVHNALAAASAALVADVDLDTVAAGLAAATLSPWRMELHRAASGAVVLNDSYNANPTSMAAALRSLVALPARRHLAVLGVMAELGPSSAADHATITELAAQLGVTVVSVGAPAYGVTDVDDPDRAVAELGPLGPDDAVLVKGSRVARLEAVAERLLAG